jgi:hypothetical protein
MMPDPNDFEARLADAFRRYAGRVPTDVDAVALAREIATASAHHAGRHRRWWPSGQTPTVIGRTQPMFSPATAIIAGALVLGLGGVMLIAQPFDQRTSPPGAATDTAPEAPVEFTGVGCLDISSTMSIVNDDGAWVSRRYRSTGTLDEPTDTGNVFIGEGAYEGLIAIMPRDDADDVAIEVPRPEEIPEEFGPCSEVHGVIIDGALAVPYLP